VEEGRVPGEWNDAGRTTALLAIAQALAHIDASVVIVDGDLRGDTGSLLPGCGIGCGHRQAARVQDVERGVVGEHGDCHIEQLAVLQRSFTDGLLSPVGNGLDDLSRLPHGQMSEPVRRRFCSCEGRDVAVHAGLDGTLTLQQVPYLGADRLLGRVDSGAHGGSS